jgi:hypothetical protein
MVRLVLLLLVLPGCSFFLDDGVLTAGDMTPPDLAIEEDMAEEPLDFGPLDAGVIDCPEFTMPGDGGVAPDWKPVNGSWKIMMVDGMPAYAQTAAPSGTTMYKTSYGKTSWRRVVLDVTIKVVGGTATECVLSRYIDKDHHYRLCLEDGKAWRLSRVDGAVITSLKTGPITYTAGSTHTLHVEARNTTLTVQVDQLAPVNHGDPFFQQGAIGLSTESTSSYSRVCAHVY